MSLVTVSYTHLDVYKRQRILSPIAIAQHSFMYCAISIAYEFKLCQDSKSKKVKYFLASLLTIANSFSIMAIANSVKLFVDNRISVVRHGNGVPARANRNAARKFSDTKQENYNQTKGVMKWRIRAL